MKPAVYVDRQGAPRCDCSQRALPLDPRQRGAGYTSADRAPRSVGLQHERRAGTRAVRSSSARASDSNCRGSAAPSAGPTRATTLAGSLHLAQMTAESERTSPLAVPWLTSRACAPEFSAPQSVMMVRYRTGSSNESVAPKHAAMAGDAASVAGRPRLHPEVCWQSAVVTRKAGQCLGFSCKKRAPRRPFRCNGQSGGQRVKDWLPYFSANRWSGMRLHWRPCSFHCVSEKCSARIREN